MPSENRGTCCTSNGGMRQWLDDDLRKVGKTFGASTACRGGGSFFLRESSVWSNPTRPAAPATTPEGETKAYAHASTAAEGRRLRCHSHHFKLGDGACVSCRS